MLEGFVVVKDGGCFDENRVGDEGHLRSFSVEDRFQRSVVMSCVKIVCLFSAGPPVANLEVQSY